MSNKNLDNLEERIGFSKSKLVNMSQRRKIDIHNADINEQLIENLLNRETYLFREVHFFTTLKELEEHYGPFRNILIVGAGHCEPVSFSLVNNNLHKIDVVELSKKSKELFNNGEFSKYEMQKILRNENMKEYMNYFYELENGNFKLDPSVDSKIKKKVSFYQNSLFDKEIQENNQNYDLVVCNNVIIYFSDEKQKEAIEILTNKMKNNKLLLCNTSIDSPNENFGLKRVKPNFYSLSL